MFNRSKTQEKKGSEKRENLHNSFSNHAQFVFAIIVENNIVSLTQQLKVMENSLCTLLGWTPRTIDRSNLKSQLFPDSLAVGIPLQLLENRPDIRQPNMRCRRRFIPPMWRGRPSILR